MIKKVKIQSIEWDNIFAMYIGYESRICMKLLQLNNDKTKQLKKDKGLKKLFLQKVYTWPTSTWKDTQSH